MTRRDWYLGGAFSAIALAISSIRYWLPSDVYFDEIYYVGSAKQYVRGTLGPSHPYFPYEWTHPPLSKLLIAFFVWCFGGNSHGLIAPVWRLPNLLLGALLVLSTYILAKVLTKNTPVACVASFLLVFDGFRFVQSRIATPEMLLAVSSMLALAALWKVCVRGSDSSRVTWVWIFVLGLVEGILISTKWSGLPLLAFSGICLWLAARYQGRLVPSIRIAAASTILLIASVYVLSYAPQIGAGWSPKDLATLQVHMYEYHDRLSSRSPESWKHPYASFWWQWPILAAPIVYYLERGADATQTGECPSPTSTCVAEIIALPNPFVWWFSLFAIIIIGLQSVREASLPKGYLIGAYLMQLVPWALSPRVDFFYNFFPAFPLMTIAAGVVTVQWWKAPQNRPYLVLAGITVPFVFLYFFPILTATPISMEAYTHRMWLDNWLQLLRLGHVHGFSWYRPN